MPAAIAGFSRLKSDSEPWPPAPFVRRLADRGTGYATATRRLQPAERDETGEAQQQRGGRPKRYQPRVPEQPTAAQAPCAHGAHQRPPLGGIFRCRLGRGRERGRG